ncbi:P-loop NTPase family protein [Granulicella mallensis]|uniref:Protein RecA n=1 Tax=Granulicella mallensis (strain ATCC BAA-1857 / DSM 23137 / MP5ACTX8) TaxID=682795 RepID=G8NT39_GRAMM|nr:recombinase RecA [Granulicella mallensis]AEU37469.1 RecA domain protein [Granulicella mallensis MP5ACTX8]
MSSASAIRLQIEAALSHRIPSALTPAPRILRPQANVGIASVDELLAGGLPLGAVTEMVGPECSGRTSFALSFVSRMTQTGKVCAWIDVSNSLHPESAAAVGMDLSRLLWVRCGVQASNAPPTPTNSFALPEKYLVPPPIKKGLHGGGFGPHPRHEVKGLSVAVSEFLKPEVTAPRCAEPQRRVRSEREVFEPNVFEPPVRKKPSIVPGKPWARIEQALHVMDLLLQGGGFSCLVLDLGSTAPEYALRIPLATWFRYRAAAERSQASILLLTQHACAKSSAALVLRLQPGSSLREETTVFTGVEYCVEVARERFLATSSNVIPLRKPPQRATEARWRGRTTWAGRR